MDIDYIVDTLVKYKDAYYNGTPLASDMDYDILEAELFAIDPYHSFFSVVGSSATNDKHKHKIPMGSLSKVKLEDNGVGFIVDNFISKQPCIVSFKADGISVSVDYVKGIFKQALTRGDGFFGDEILDATSIQNFPNELNSSRTCTLRGELVMHYDMFDYVNSLIPDGEKFSNPRNAVAGIARKENSPYKKYLTVKFYNVVDEIITYETKADLLEDLTLLVGHDAVIEWAYYDESDIDLFKSKCNLLDKERKSLPYMIDGVVVEFDNLEYAESLGSSDNKPKCAIALKFNAVAETTTVLDIVWQVGSTGSLCPVICMTPTLVDGSIVSRASIHNYDIFKSWNFGKGDVIEIQKNNDIIPQVKSVVEHVGMKFEIPTYCPVCDSILELKKINTTNLCCTNPACKAKFIGSVKKWATKSGMTSKGVGDAFFESFVDRYDAVEDLYTLSVADIRALSDRYQAKSAKNIYDAIQGSKTLLLDGFFGGLNIDGCGSRTFKKIIQAFDLSNVESTVEVIKTQDLSLVDGIGNITAKAMRDGVIVLENRIAGLLKHVKIFSENIVTYRLGSFLFTGKFSQKKSDLEDMAIKAGGSIVDNVSSNLTYLVQSDPTSTSAKTIKAQKLGISIISEEQFLGIVK